MIGAGGTVDFLAGRLKRAPLWMQRMGMESVFRIIQEPRRLFKRYATDLVQFVPALISQLWHLPGKRSKKFSSEHAPSFTTTTYGIKVQATECLHRDVLQDASFFWNRAAQQQGHCLIDLSEVQSIDSTGIAFLAHWQKRLARVQRNLILFRPSSAVLSAFERMHLTEKFIITDGKAPSSQPARVAFLRR
jgi:N-acetylglucosaminyldiphosphoundecaprenol N-acetyl-beta-D-mannosaminyltransferase